MKRRVLNNCCSTAQKLAEMFLTGKIGAKAGCLVNSPWLGAGLTPRAGPGFAGRDPLTQQKNGLDQPLLKFGICRFDTTVHGTSKQ